MSRSFKAHVDPLLMKQLIQKSNQKGILHFGIFFLVLFGVGILSFQLLGTCWFFSVYLIYAIIFAFSEAAAHELNHDSVFRSRWLNTFAHWLVCFMSWWEPIYSKYSIYDTIQKHRWSIRILRARRFDRKALDWWWLRCLQDFFPRKNPFWRHAEAFFRECIGRGPENGSKGFASKNDHSVTSFPGGLYEPDSSLFDAANLDVGSVSCPSQEPWNLPPWYLFPNPAYNFSRQWSGLPY